METNETPQGQVEAKRKKRPYVLSGDEKLISAARKIHRSLKRFNENEIGKILEIVKTYKVQLSDVETNAAS